MGSYISRQYDTCGKASDRCRKYRNGYFQGYQSYASAVILLQNCFFFPEKTFLTENSIRLLSPKGPGSGFPAFTGKYFFQISPGRRREPCFQFLDELFRYYSCNHTFMPNQIRDLYYQLFNTLSASRKKNQLETELHEKQDLIVDTLNNAFTYEELHKALKEKTAQYFEDAKNSQPENSTIFMIKDYISRNYMNDTLSVKDISGHVYLSASYVWHFFQKRDRTDSQSISDRIPNGKRPSSCFPDPNTRFPRFLPR